MQTRDKIIEVSDLVKFFGKFRALDGVAFDVYRSDVFGFLGPNGAGKSTTLRILLALIQPTSGYVKIFGNDVASHRREILQRIGCIVEKPDFYNYLSALRNIEIFARLSGYDIPGKRIYEMLEFVGLKGREKDKVQGYSHGMKQRLGIAQTLLHDPELIILDEPTTGLDPQGIIDIRNLILKLKEEQNKTIILSSHILSEIELIANRMVIINKGKTIVQGSVSELLSTQDMIVSINTSDAVMAGKLIKSDFKNTSVEEIRGNNILLHAPREMVPEINRMLCEKGVSVYSIESRRRLEDYFLKLIEE